MFSLILAHALLAAVPASHAAETDQVEEVADKPTYTKFVLRKGMDGAPSILVLSEQMGGLILSQFIVLDGVERDGLWRFEVPGESRAIPYLALLLDPQGQVVAIVGTPDGPMLATTQDQDVQVGGGGRLFMVNLNDTRPIENAERILGP